MTNQQSVTSNQLPVRRPPVVVILGHVDHGKTKILDYIRKTKVAEGEAGGITQHIGAYQVVIGPSEASGREKLITFLDTPGHEAFSAIRSRGATVADVAVLVVAADESVKPQTAEAIKIIEEARVPLVVAINKIDKENANPLKVKQDLAEKNVLVEDWGGKVPVVEVSAKTGQGIDALLDMILLVAEIEARPQLEQNVPTAVVIESHLDKQRGLVATLLVQKGFFKVNDWITAGNQAVRIKFMEDFLGQSMAEAEPSQPTVVLGWEEAPVLGEVVYGTSSREEAETLAQKQAQSAKPPLFPHLATALLSGKILNLIVKADVASSLEAIDQVLKTIPCYAEGSGSPRGSSGEAGEASKSEEVGYRVVDYGVGDISEGDVKKAVAMKALVVGFHTSISSLVKQLAERHGVAVEVFQIIYELVESVKKKMSELLEPEINRLSLGRLKVLALFKKEAKSQVVGGKVTTGKIKRGALVEVWRNNQAVATGRLSQLQQQKADVEEVAEGLEAGIRFEFQAKTITPNMYIREGDVLEVYEEEKIRRSL